MPPNTEVKSVTTRLARLVRYLHGLEWPHGDSTRNTPDFIEGFNQGSSQHNQAVLERLLPLAREQLYSPEGKFFEVRDRATCISTYAVVLPVGLAREGDGEEAEQIRAILGRAGWYSENAPVYMTHLGTMRTTFHPHEWSQDGTRTMQVAHRYIAEHWDELANGAVVDVRFILGETQAPAAPDRLVAAGEA